jgi:DNA-binding NarL/FixJ family response regulator
MVGLTFYLITARVEEQMILQRALRKHYPDCAVHVFDRCANAVATLRLKQATPDVVFIDRSAEAGEDGLEGIRHLRRVGLQCCVVFRTANLDPRLAAAAIEAGASIIDTRTNAAVVQDLRVSSLPPA